MGNLGKITDPMVIIIRVVGLMTRCFWFLWEFIGFLYFFTWRLQRGLQLVIVRLYKDSLQNQLQNPCARNPEKSNNIRPLTARLEDSYSSITVANRRLITVIRFVAKSYTHPWKGFANRPHLVLHACKIHFSACVF